MKSFVRTPFDIPILIFLLSGLIGYWASYDAAASLPKLLMLFGAVVVYYAIVCTRQTPRRLQVAVWVYLVSGAGAALYFIAQTDFGANPTKVELFTRVGMGLNAFLPRLTNQSPHPNLAAGAFAIVFPFAFLGAIHWSRQRAWPEAGAAALCTGVIALGLLLTTSRGAWLAIALVAAGVVTVLAAIALYHHRAVVGRWRIIAAVIVLGALAGGAVYLALDFLSMQLSALFSIGDSVASRLTLYQETWELVKEYLFTGAGLGVFPLVLSAYVLLIDAPLYGHAHNLFLAVWIEQGILGIGALLWLLIAFGRRGWQERHAWNWLTTASFIAIGIWMLHGLVDAPVYESHALLVMFAPFAFAFASIPNATGSEETAPAASQRTAWRGARKWILLALLLAGLVVLVRWNVWTGMLYANLGAVQETKAELALYRFDKPIIEVRSIMEIRRTLTGQLDSAQALYQRALGFDSTNQVALRRLGLIALAKRDFGAAARQLDAALQANPNNRATRKGLGYAYAWSGETDQAASLLEPFGETRLELADDTWWWSLEERPELAIQAQKVLERVTALDAARGQ